MLEKGPPVFLNYDQAALDAAYDQAAYAPNREQLIERRIGDSGMARGRIGEPERIAYGSAEIEWLDIYRTGAHRGAGLCLYPWRRLARRALEGFRGAGRDVPRRRGALHRARLRLGAGCRRQLDGARRSGPPRRRLGLRKHRSLRR